MQAAREQQIKDSLFMVERHKKDSILREKIIRESATDVIATTPLPISEAIDFIAKALIAADYMISVDKEYCTIKTERVSCGNATYSLYFRFSEKENGTEVRSCGFFYGTIGVAMHGVLRTSEQTVKAENGESTLLVSHQVFKSHEKIIRTLPDAQITYKRIVK